MALTEEGFVPAGRDRANCPLGSKTLLQTEAEAATCPRPLLLPQASASSCFGIPIYLGPPNPPRPRHPLRGSWALLLALGELCLGFVFLFLKRKDCFVSLLRYPSQCRLGFVSVW